MHRAGHRYFLLATLLVLLLAILSAARPALAYTGQLLRYPYLTDVVAGYATLNWGTDRSFTVGSATYGLAGVESCTAHRVNASKTSITVGQAAEYQWKARITGLAPNTRYCYRVFLGSPAVDLLGSDPAPTFWSQVAAGSTQPYSFAVLGDWGAVDTSGGNPDQANLMHQIATSGARFVLGTGDTAYPSGSQTNYGDLVQVGSGVSTVFGPAFYKDVGAGVPMFNALGNHGMNATFLMLWPSTQAAATSGGRSQMDTYCCTNGTASASYPSIWYAFDAGPARFYLLDAGWPSSNVGTADIYKNDYDNHWTPSSPEYQWLAADLASHPAAVKFAVMHFPMYSDNATETSDLYLRGPGGVGGLLSQYGVDMVFSGHAHMYERNLRQPGDSFVSYLTGGGGGKLEPIGAKGCSGFDAAGIGWSNSSSRGSACGAAAVPDSITRVFHFLLVTVQGTHVTVVPTDELGRTFDVRAYDF
jgi:calcineurin-like phosphoesterase family protein/purple acid phosphatase-like protein